MLWTPGRLVQNTRNSRSQKLWSFQREKIARYCNFSKGGLCIIFVDLGLQYLRLRDVWRPEESNISCKCDSLPGPTVQHLLLHIYIIVACFSCLDLKTHRDTSMLHVFLLSSRVRCQWTNLQKSSNIVRQHSSYNPKYPVKKLHG